MPRLVKITDKWGSALLGTAKVLSDKNGFVVSETEPNSYGVVKLKFKAIGASKQSAQPDINGNFRWRHQRSWFSCDKTDPIAKIVQSLDVGDKIWVFGVLKKSEYIDNNTGRQRKSLFCNLEDIRIMVKADENVTNTTNQNTMDHVDTDSDDFSDFDLD